MILKYILVDKVAVPCDDLRVWGAFFNDPDKRRVGLTRVGQITVSTVFLGIDHGFFDDGPPLLFETMMSDGDFIDDYQTRCSTWEEAVEMHEVGVAAAAVKMAAAEQGFNQVILMKGTAT